MNDRFNDRSIGFDTPAIHGFVIVPDDGEDLAEVTRMLYVGTGGDITIVLKEGSEVVLKNVSDGRFLPLRAIRVKATGTTAADIVGLV